MELWESVPNDSEYWKERDAEMASWNAKEKESPTVKRSVNKTWLDSLQKHFRFDSFEVTEDKELKKILEVHFAFFQQHKYFYFYGKDLRIAQNQTNLLVTESEKLETQVKKAEQEVMIFGRSRSQRVSQKMINSSDVDG